MPKPHFIERRLETPRPEPSRPSSRLPDALLSDHVRRLAICAGVGAALWSYGLLMETIVRPLTIGVSLSPFNAAIEIVGIVVSLLMVAYVRYAPGAPDGKITAGLLYFVLSAAGVALINVQTGLASVVENGGISWNTVVILVAAMILPATPRQMLVASLAAASTDPLALWLGPLRNAPAASVASTVVLYLPNFACAIVALVPSRVLQRIGRRLRQAQELGSYELVELLGRGGMGEVWRARHRLLARDAALKLIRPELLGAAGAAETHSMFGRFEREAQATAALSSPHTIRVFDFGATADQTFYYVMELLEGRDLQSLVREFGPVPAGRALFLLRQVCRSLAEAHTRGLIHRDVTPSNVYVCRMGLDYDFVKVLDFGLVKFNTRSTRLEDPSRTAGTPAFMAPEIVFGLKVDQRADVYAIGCIAYFLLTGQAVFEATTTAELFRRHSEERPVPPSQRTEIAVPAELDALVMACLEKDPARRPANAGAVLEWLLRCRSADVWDHDSARTWWERHLVELTLPLSADNRFVPASLLAAS